MELKLYIKQALQFQQKTGNVGYYQGNNPQTLAFVQGTLPAVRQWSNYGNYVNVTHEVSDISKIKLTWTTERDENGMPTIEPLQPKKSASGTITFEGETYKMLKSWLIDDVSAPLNSVDVKIEHVGCGTYENYEIKSTDLKYCEINNICVFQVVIKQKDEALKCIQRTLIIDNWQGWFQPQPANNMKHPRFSYCNEERPNGKLVAKWFNMMVMCVFLITLMLPFIILWNSLVAIVKAIIAVVNTLGGNISSNLDYIKFGDLKDSWGVTFVESAGCGREHPAPLIRDYITNVCDKCGVKVDGTTAPIFFANQIDVLTSNKQRGNQGLISTENPHYNACYLYATTKRGIRRFGNFGLGALFGDTDPNTTDFYIYENAPIMTLDMFLDQLKALYNAEWQIKSIMIGGVLVPHLYFNRKDFYKNKPGNYIFNFSPTHPDRNKMVEGICYEWNGKKTPAYCKGLYADDNVDTCGDEAKSQMNSAISFGDVDNNPTFGGVLDKTTQFGATKFRLDGASTDYIFDAMQVIVNSQILTGFAVGFMRDIVYPPIREYADYALLLRDEKCALPKILIWDGQSYENAKCRKNYYASGYGGGQEPAVNPVYNKGGFLSNLLAGQQNINLSFPVSWPVKHPLNNFVIGSSLSLGNKPQSTYKVQDFFGINVAEQPAMLVNYPMYFEPGFYDTMWDWWHWIDDPVVNPTLNMNWSVKIQLCCEDLKRIKPFNNASEIQLLQKYKLDSKWYNDGIATEYTVSYDTEDELGQYIEIKGTV